MFVSGADAQRLDTHLRITRIIVVAMMMGVVSFTAAVIFAGRERGGIPSAAWSASLFNTHGSSLLGACDVVDSVALGSLK